jgi:hypothetical protein
MEKIHACLYLTSTWFITGNIKKKLENVLEGFRGIFF